MSIPPILVVGAIISIIAGLIAIIRFILDCFDLWPPKNPPNQPLQMEWTEIKPPHLGS